MPQQHLKLFLQVISVRVTRQTPTKEGFMTRFPLYFTQSLTNWNSHHRKSTWPLNKQKLISWTSRTSHPVSCKIQRFAPVSRFPSHSHFSSASTYFSLSFTKTKKKNSFSGQRTTYVKGSVVMETLDFYSRKTDQNYTVLKGREV